MPKLRQDYDGFNGHQFPLHGRYFVVNENEFENSTAEVLL